MERRLTGAAPQPADTAFEFESGFDGTGAEVRLKILITEDNPVNQRLALAALERMGHERDVADDGQECLDLVLGNSYDLILMDVQMPRMDGVEATMRIRALEQTCGTHMPIVGLTANAFPEDRIRYLMAGMDAVLVKPIRPRALREGVEQACRQARRTRLARTDVAPA